MGQMSIVVDVMTYIFRDHDHSELLLMNGKFEIRMIYHK